MTETKPLERKRNLSVDEFTHTYLVGNRPIVISDGMDQWAARDRWTPQFLAERFGDVKVQVYNDLFLLIGVHTLSHYLGKYFGQSDSTKRRPSYVRWYTRLSPEDRVPWADDIFDALQTDWSMPGFLPTSGYLLPFCPPDGSIDPSSAPFPARGLFISAKGARTRLHVDPWCSDALLCQIHGEKEFRMYAPDQVPFLSNGENMVDVSAPDLDTFPDFPKATASVHDKLSPGEMLLVPHGWAHHVDTLTDSISLTWNFVHSSCWAPFFRYLDTSPPEKQLDTIRYFLTEIPGRKY